MDKQHLAHQLEKEISLINIDLRRLCRIHVQMIDSHQAREVEDVIQNLSNHKRFLEKVIVNIVEDAKNHDPSLEYGF